MTVRIESHETLFHSRIYSIFIVEIGLSGYEFLYL